MSDEFTCKVCSEPFALHDKMVLIVEGRMGFNDNGAGFVVEDEDEVFAHPHCVALWTDPEGERQLREEVTAKAEANVSTVFEKCLTTQAEPDPEPTPKRTQSRFTTREGRYRIARRRGRRPFSVASE